MNGSVDKESVMNGSLMDMIWYERVCHEHGLFRTGLLWTWLCDRVSYEQVCLERVFYEHGLLRSCLLRTWAVV